MSIFSRSRIVLGLCLCAAAAWESIPPAAAAPVNEEARALVDHARAYRRVSASALRDRLGAWFQAGEATLPSHLREQLGALQDLPPGDGPLDDLCLAAALLHALGTDPRFQEEGLGDSLYAAAASLAQEAVFRFHESGAPFSLDLDSLRAVGDPARVSPDEGVGSIAAPSALPTRDRPKKAYLEKGTPTMIRIPTPPVDWYGWMLGEDRALVRGGGVLYLIDPADGSLQNWEPGGGYRTPPPSVSFSGEYVAAVGDDGVLRIRRFGVAARDWRVVVHGLRPTAFAFSPDPPRLAVADTAGRILVYTVDKDRVREVAETGGVVVELDWSPSGDALAWDLAGTPVAYRAGSLDLGDGRPALPTPGEAGIVLAGEPQWAPTGTAALAVGTHDGRSGLWAWDAEGATLLESFPVGEASAVLVSPDFSRVAVVTAPHPHPQPWGWSYATPFGWDASPLAVFNVRWSEAAGSPRLDPPPHHLENLGWSGRADWVIRRFDEHAETLDASRSQRLRQGLWALNLTTGDDIPLTLEAGDYRMPRLSGRQGWLLYLEVTEDGGAGNPPRGALWARPIEASAGGLRHAERLHLRASPLIDAGRYEEALPYLRDALRLNPGLNDARLALAEAGMAMAETTEGSAAAGLLLAHAVRELTLLAAGSPTTPLYRRELTRAFLGYAVVAGRIQAAAAADRGRAFLEGDPDRQASPEQVRSVLQPDLIDAILWDPAPEDGWRLLESALDYYRGP